MTEKKKDQIGYMPEERGLYQDIPLDRCLTYLGSLKGLEASQVHERAEGYLQRFDLAPHAPRRSRNSARACSRRRRSSPPCCTSPNC